MEDYDMFFRNRITQLRLQKGLSEYQLSYNLGHSRGYINNISSGKSLPSLNEFFLLCEYFGITPSEFFDVNNTNPEAITRSIDGLKNLNETDLALVLEMIERLQSK